MCIRDSTQSLQCYSSDYCQKILCRYYHINLFIFCAINLEIALLTSKAVLICIDFVKPCHRLDYAFFCRIQAVNLKAQKTEICLSLSRAAETCIPILSLKDNVKAKKCCISRFFAVVRLPNSLLCLRCLSAGHTSAYHPRLMPISFIVSSFHSSHYGYSIVCITSSNYSNNVLHG